MMTTIGGNRGTNYSALVLLAGCLIGGPIAEAATPVSRLLGKPDDWYASDAACEVTDHVLAHQSPLGGWPKNTDTTASSKDREPGQPTFDNGATTDELRLLARMVDATGDPKFAEAFGRGLDYVLSAQYPTGGWPQFHPPGKQYHRHITFNDNAMVRIMLFLRDVATDDRYAFVPAERRNAAQLAFDRGVACILRCQMTVDGKLTAWCAQHDELDYSARPARTYELASLSGNETAGITRLLMSLERPSPEVIRSVDAAAAWLDEVPIEGYRHIDERPPGGPRRRELVKDDSAPPIWARFYEIGTNRPLYANRDGVPRYRYDEVEDERRFGYAWLGDWPQRLIEVEYPRWKAQRGNDSSN